MLRLWRSFFGSGPDADDAGGQAERLAAEWLRRERGFTILTQNWRNPRDRREEIDLIGRDREVLVFVEVKARAAGAMVPGFYAVNRRKKRVLLRAAKAYLARLSPKPRGFRLDVVEISIPPGGLKTARRNPTPAAPGGNGGAEPRILHFENVPLFSKHFRG